MSGVYDGDQPTTAPVVIGQTDTNVNDATLDAIVAAAAEAPVYMFSANYTFMWHGQVISFRYGVPYQLDAGLLAALAAASAPIIAA